MAHMDADSTEQEAQHNDRVFAAIRGVFAAHRSAHEAWCEEATREAGMSGCGHTYTTSGCVACRGPLETDLIAAVAAVKD